MSDILTDDEGARTFNASRARPERMGFGRDAAADALRAHNAAQAALITELRAMLGELVHAWILGGDCYKHMPDEVVRRARLLVGDTPEAGR